MALEWEDVDLERSVLRAKRILTHTDKACALGESKTKESCRTVRLTAGTA